LGLIAEAMGKSPVAAADPSDPTGEAIDAEDQVDRVHRKHEGNAEFSGLKSYERPMPYGSLRMFIAVSGKVNVPLWRHTQGSAVFILGGPDCADESRFSGQFQWRSRFDFLQSDRRVPSPSVGIKSGCGQIGVKKAFGFDSIL
jgi:hypothetical protein